MAGLGYYDDKLLGNDPMAGQQGSGSGGMVPGSGQAVGSGTSGVVSGSSTNTAGVGAGGQGSWTNIQAYLNANKNDTGSAKSLENKVGGVLGQEKEKLDQAATSTINQANDQAKIYDDAKNNTKEWVNKAANAYSWDNQHGDDYRNTVNKVQSLRTQQYGGPQNFSYANSADLSRAGEALNQDQAFKPYLDDLYKERTGGKLNAGQAALQNQFDVNNENLNSTRQRLATQIAGFDTTRNDAVKNADQSIQSAQAAFRNGQSGYNDYLQNLANEYDSNINQQEIDARSAYNNSYTKDRSGRANTYWDRIDPQEISPIRLQDTWGGDLTFKQLQNEQNLANSGFSYYTSPFLDNPNDPGRRAKFTDNTNELNKFHGQQDEKYGMTADAEERKYNTLSEILGSLNKKDKGFKVRG